MGSSSLSRASQLIRGVGRTPAATCGDRPRVRRRAGGPEAVCMCRRRARASSLQSRLSATCESGVRRARDGRRVRLHLVGLGARPTPSAVVRYPEVRRVAAMRAGCEVRARDCARQRPRAQVRVARAALSRVPSVTETTGRTRAKRPSARARSTALGGSPWRKKIPLVGAGVPSNKRMQLTRRGGLVGVARSARQSSLSRASQLIRGVGRTLEP